MKWFRNIKGTLSKDHSMLGLRESGEGVLVP